MTSYFRPVVVLPECLFIIVAVLQDAGAYNVTLSLYSKYCNATMIEIKNTLVESLSKSTVLDILLN